MQNNNKKTNRKKVTLKPVYKPYLRGNVASKTAAKRGLRVFGFVLVFAFIYVIAGLALNFDNNFLRVLCNAVLLLAAAMVMYAEGANQGETDVSFAEIAQERLNEGHKVAESERDLCFHPLKGLFTVALGVLPLFVVCLLYAFMAEKQTHSLSVLPSWVGTYESQSEISLALAYYYETAPFALADVLRVIVRMINFPFVTIVGVNNYDLLYLMDKLSPVLCLVVPGCYLLGYLRGPHLRALVHGNIRMNRRKQNKREMRARAQRREQMKKKNEKKELI